MRDSEVSYGQILALLRRLRLRGVLLLLAESLLLGLGLALLLGLAWVGLEAWLYLSPPWRAGLGLAAAFFPCLVLGFHLGRRLPALLSLKSLGLRVEARCPQMRQQLISSLELWPEARASRLYSAELIGATVEQAVRQMALLEPRRVIGLEPLRQRARLAGGAGLAVALAFLPFGESLEGALSRCARPLTPFARPALTRIGVDPGDAEVVKGEDLSVRIRLDGEQPHTARLRRREAGAASWQDEEMAVAGDSLRYVFRQVQRPFEYQVQAGDGLTPAYQVRVVEPPVVQRLRLEYHYPEYSGLPARIDEEDGDISGLAGTLVHLELKASQALAAAMLVLDDTLRQAMQVEETRATARLQIARDGHYHLELVDRQGLAGRKPIRYAIQALADAPPSVALTAPGRDADLPEDMKVELQVEAADDFGVARLWLVWRINAQAEKRQALSFRPGRQLSLAHPWELAALDLLPEDRVHYRVEAFDSDQVSGPKMSATPEYVLRYPSLQELHEEIAQTQEESLDTLETWVREEEKTQEYLEQARREALRDQELSWQQKKELESALAREEARARAVEELAQQLQETVEKLEQGGLASPEILEKLEEIRQLMAEVTAPELQEALARLQQAVDSASPEELAQALKEFGEDHQAFQQRLDRTLALLRQIRAEQQLEGAVRRAEELQRRQEQINAGTERREEGLAAQEERLERDTESLRQDLQALGEEMKPISEETGQRLQAQARTMDEQGLSPRMQEMTHQLSGQQMDPARRLGESLAGDLKTLSSSLRQLQGEFAAKQKKKLGRELEQAMRDLLQLSGQQEALSSLGQSPLAPPPGELAQEQFALLQGAGLVTEHLARVGQQTLSLAPGLNTTLGYSLRHMQQAARILGQQEPQQAAAPQAEAMRYLNESVLLLRQSLDNLSRSQMPSSFGEAMQQLLGLSEQQAGLNQATQQSLAEGQQPGSRGRGRDWRQELGRLAAQQERISQALELLERDLRGHGGAHRRVQAIQEEMKSALDDLRNRRLSQATLDTQNRILHRMLDASRSIHTQGFEEKRRAEAGQDQEYVGPGALPAELGQEHDRLRLALKRALEGPYPEEYRALIEAYYEQVYQDLMDQRGRR